MHLQLARPVVSEPHAPGWTEAVTAGRLGAALLEAGTSVTDVHRVVVRAHRRRPDGADHSFAVLPTAVLISDPDTGETRTVFAGSGTLSIRQGAAVHRLARSLATDRMSSNPALASEEVDGALLRIRGMTRLHPMLPMIVGNALLSIGLAAVFRCPWWATLGAAVIGGLVAALLQLTKRIAGFGAVAPFAVALISASLVGLFAEATGLRAVPVFAACAPIAILVPGTLIANGLLELTASDIVTGASRVVYGVIVLLFMTAGIGAGAGLTDLHFIRDATTLLGESGTSIGTAEPWNELPPTWVAWPAVALIALGIGLYSDSGVRVALLWIPVMLATYLGVLLLTPVVGTPIATGATAAVLCVATRALGALVSDLPTPTVFLPAFMLLVPGTVGLTALASLRSGEAGVISAASTFLALCIGVSIGSFATAPLLQRSPRADHAPDLQR